MEGLSPLEKAVLERLLAGEHPVLAALRIQAERGKLASREHTGVGVFCNFAIPRDAPRITSHKRIVFGDVHARIDGLEYGAGFLVFVIDGYLGLLEGYSFDGEPWPEVVGQFALLEGPPSAGLPDDTVIDWGQ